MWIRRYFDPTAFFADILSDKFNRWQDPDDWWDSEYLESRKHVFEKIPDHPANLMLLETSIHRELFDRFRLTVNPFTYRKFLTYVPEVDWPANRDATDVQLFRIKRDPQNRAYVDCGRNELAAAYPSRLALFIHFKSCLRHQCTWDTGASDQDQPEGEGGSHRWDRSRGDGVHPAEDRSNTR